MPKAPRHHRTPLVSLLLFSLLIAVALFFSSLLHFDLSNYRQRIAATLEQSLKRPVSLGDAAIAFNRGLTLDLRNLQIGADEDFSLSLPHLSATLNPWGLFKGEVQLKQILIDNPSGHIRLPLKMAQTKIDLASLSLTTLQIREGSLLVSQIGDASPTRVDHFNLVAHGLGRGKVLQFATTTNIQRNNQPSEFKLFLKLTRQSSKQQLRQAKLEGNLSLTHLRAYAPHSKFLKQSPALKDFMLQASGVPSQGVKLHAALGQVNPLQQAISIVADWYSSPQAERLSHIQLGESGPRVKGAIVLSSLSNAPQLKGDLHLEGEELSQLLAVLQLPTKGISGTLKTLDLQLDGPLRPTAEKPHGAFKALNFSLMGVSYTKGNTELTELSCDAHLQPKSFEITNGRGLFAQIPFNFSASSDPEQTAPQIFDIRLNAAPQLETLKKRLKAPFWQRQTLSGQANLQATAHGTLNNLSTKLDLDLSATEIGLGTLLHKSAAVPFKLAIKSIFNTDTLQIGQLGLILDQVRLSAHGDLHKTQKGWQGALELAPFELATLQTSSDLFQHFKISGHTQGTLELGADGVKTRLHLTNGGAHFTRLIGDLNQVKTEVVIDKEGIDFGHAQALLGASHLRVDGALRNWRAALIDLHVSAAEVRAQDLVFTNQQMKLQDLDGYLLINKGGINFESIRLKVENRTSLEVSGQLRDFHDPQTQLEITADEADILDVIHLFNGPSKFPGNQHKPTDASLRISALVKKGRLGSFYFEEAHGRILDRHNVFTLEPVNLKLGHGGVLGRVEFEHKRNNLLKISGHAENCDADRVYEMLFEKKGIFRGNLSGDFYLEGEEIGDHFWQTANGGGHLQIKDGVMRELNGLAQVFSLLNISQLFKFQLPDMDKEGLPFSLFTVSGRMTDGILRFEDLKIVSPAINISAIGQIDTLQKTVDATLGIKPLRTVDIILSNVPLFGWVLTGDEEALITALFNMKGPLEDPKVSAAPVSSITNTALGIIGRTLGLPFRLIKKTGELFSTPPAVNTGSEPAPPFPPPSGKN